MKNINKALKLNLGYQTIYQIISTITPLITAPYISRKLGAENLGFFSYTSSIVTYFSIFAKLGIVNYGNRSIASVKESKEERSKEFVNIYMIQIMSSLIMLILYFLCSKYIFVNEYKMLLFQGLFLLSEALDISWFYFGIEKFKLTALRSSIIKIITVASILLFVKNDSHLYRYTFIMGMSNIISAIVLWLPLHKYISLQKIDINILKRSIKPIMILFVPIIASSIYHVMDKTMLGSLSTYNELGYYYNADKVINIPINIFNGITTVMLPQITIKISNNQDEKNLIEQSFEIIAFLAFGISFGIAAVAKEFVPVFFGNGYEKCEILIYGFVPVMLIKIFAMFIRMEILIPRNKDKVYMYAVLAGVIVNFCANYKLISLYGSVGAVIATFVAELTVCITQLVFIRREISIKKLFIENIDFLIVGVLMIFLVRIFSMTVVPTLIKLVIEISVGGGFYTIVCFTLKKRKVMLINKARNSK